MNPITATKADAIRDRFLRIAAERRADAARTNDPADAARLIALAESQERMAAKRYEAMTVRAI